MSAPDLCENPAGRIDIVRGVAAAAGADSRRVSARLRALAVAACLAALGSCGDDAPDHARLVAPVFKDPCRYDQCSEHGACAVGEASGPVCLCEVGYRGAVCDGCEPGFHFDSMGRCVPDRSCAEQEVDPCGIHGTCNDELGVIACECEEGYEGPRCNLCASGRVPDVGDCLELVIVRGSGGDGTNAPPTGNDAGAPVADACVEEDCNGHGDRK